MGQHDLLAYRCSRLKSGGSLCRNAFRSASIRVWSIVYLLRMGCGKVQILAAATTQFKRQVAPEQ
jgi:hypothetical protein